ncbi:MAG TPA: beta-ketoacyl synthase N-terminal-like domain-containing protein [Thermoanaerobaculia bacterium]|nr:beta-ketoacyl synthase N-terminal-like domain-containing protein [Thermoanaerobaculia bacterium]
MSDEPIETPNSRDIAVVGMAGRFPGARDLAQLWRNLRDGVESVTWLRDEELLAAGTAPELLANPRFVRAASLLDGVESFDAPFFGYSAHEAAIMDPQQRLFLEHAWAALEDAGHLPARFDGLIGVYAGVAWNTYLLSNLTTHPELFAGGGGFQVFITNDKDFMPTRVSYKLDLKGPSLIVQTSCSTSLVATHLACLSLLNYECDMALAGGVTVRVPQHQGYLYLDGGLASPDGHCRSFDAAAAGTIFGSGVGVVVLRRLADALADGDPIQAVIKGSAINNDGSLKVSYTAPAVEGQSEVIAAAQAMAGIDPETIGYVEAHGTATALGDPVEVMALTRVFRERTAKTGFCGLGSIKSNFGHLDAAAGVAGLIKTILALKHRQIPPSLHFETPNPAIDFATSPFYVNAKLADWPETGAPRRAAVSSFGVGGTNAHVILEEAPEPEPAAPARPWQLLVLSARSEEALEEATDRLADRLGEDAAPDIPDIAYTLRTGRAVFRHRRMLVCAVGENPADLLRRRDPGEVLTAVDDEDPRARPVVFLLPGQGAQHLGMGRDLYAEEPVFRDAIDRSAELLLPHLGLDLRRLLWPPAEETEETDDAAKRLQQTDLTQPALFAVELALAQLWMSWGVQPQALLGHSLGELTAACLAGVFSLADAHALVVARGRSIAELPPGAMLSVPLAEAEIAPLLTPDLALAAVNEPARSVVSGPEAAIADLEARLDTRGVRSRRLHTSHAFHSPMMEPAVAPFTSAVRRCSLTPPRIPFLSNVTGTWVTPEQAIDPAYWGSQLLQPVRFAAAVSQLLTEPRRILLEVGPGRTLSTAASRHPERQGQPVIASLGHPQDTAPEGKHLLTALGRLWLAGLDLDPALFYEGETRRRVPLPTYPFARQKYWIEPGIGREIGQIRPIGPISPIDSTPEITKRPDPADWFYLPVFRIAEPLTAPQGPARRVLVIAAERVGTALAKALAAAGHEVVTARIEEIAALRAGGFVPEVVVHAGTLGPHPPNPPLPVEGGAMGEGSGVRSPAAFEAAQEHGLYSLLTLARELAPTADQSIDLVVVTDHLLGVTAGEPAHPEKAPLLGFCRVLPLEQPGISCRCLDVALPATGSRQEAQLLDLLAVEVMAHGGEEVVALRGLQRWVPGFEPLRLPATAAPKPLLRERGVYLLTGGLAGNGFALAGWLARTARARLVLLESLDAAPRPERVRTLEELGGEVLIVTADTEEASLQRALVAATERFGPPHGVIHAAGLHGEQAFQPIAEAGRAGCALSFSAKVHPLFALERELAGLDLDFCVLLSSLTAQLGGVANVADCAANLVLDAFARRHNQGTGTPWLSLEWDVWNLAENEDGQITALRRDLAALAMSPEEGEAAFRHALALAAACPLADVVTVSTGDMAARLAERRSLRQRHTQPQAARARAAATPHPRPLATPFNAPVSELEQRIATLWQEALGYAPIGLDDNFFELGGDSFVAVQVVSRLRDELRIEISAARLYQGLTVRALAALIAGTIAGDEKPRSEALEERRASMSRRQEFQERRRAGRRGAEE